jgi:hypothetical protein
MNPNPPSQDAPSGESPTHLQEQYTGPLENRFERTAAEVLDERRSEAHAEALPPVFLP